MPITDPDALLTADRDGVRVITLNRPSARNALSRDLIRATYAALTAADADRKTREGMMNPYEGMSRIWGYGRYMYQYSSGIDGYDGGFRREGPRHPNRRQRPVESHKTIAARLSKKERKRRKQTRRR